MVLDAACEVSGAGFFRGSHIAYFENTWTSDPPNSTDGIAIQLGATSAGKNNNFMTFYNGNEEVVGRIEGFLFGD